MGNRQIHRGANGDIVVFARDFISKRSGGLRKDIDICLTDTPAGDGIKMTHAYFPALGACCGFLEYMTALHRGRLTGIGWNQVLVWTRKYMPQPAYNDDIVRVLFNGFRHSVAHRGIATGIYMDDPREGRSERRITWKLTEYNVDPACELIAEAGTLVSDPPWPAPYSHRMHIHLASLARDLCGGAAAYADDLGNDSALQVNFRRAMHALYPR